MYKKLLCTGIAVLSISSAAFASGTMYTTPTPVATPTGCNDASDSYFYLGIQGGAAVSGWKSVNGLLDNATLDVILPPATLTTDTLSANNTTGIAGRAFLGYSFNKYFAAELGYFYMGKKADVGVDSTTVDFENKIIDVTHFDGKIKTQAFDLVGKVKAPIADTGLGVYAKLGAGYLMMKGQDDFSGYKSNKVDLVYGAGVSYDFNENWAMDVSWTRYNSGETKIESSKWQPNVDFYALGVTYKFAGV